MLSNDDDEGFVIGLNPKLHRVSSKLINHTAMPTHIANLFSSTNQWTTNLLNSNLLCVSFTSRERERERASNNEVF